MKSILPFFSPDAIPLDKRLKRAVHESVNSVVQGTPLSLTAIGRGLGVQAQQIEKHAIKRADRLLGNTALQAVRLCFYQQVAHYFIQTQHPLISVDWSSMYNYDFVMLRASMSVNGRAVVLYEQVHPQEKHTNASVHKQFLRTLSQVLPPGCQPIICTDAGFKVPWFEAVEKHGWYWLSRVRGTVKCRLEESKQWYLVNHYHTKATRKARELPGCMLRKNKPYACRVVLYQGKNKGRHNHNRKGITTRDNQNIKMAKAAQEPWFLATNLPEHWMKAHQVVCLYRRRMSIEESFRDTKSPYYGLGLKHSRTRSSERLQILLLIGMLAQLTLMLIGKAGELAGYHRHFQANTTCSRRVLSYVYLGRRLIQHARYRITHQALSEASAMLIEESHYE